jgi:RecB family exonuclease
MRDESMPESYKTELLRAKMLVDLRRLAACDPWPANYESQGEVSCRFELDGGLVIRCRIDRLIKTDDGRAFVIDYKYSPKTRDKLTDENLLQGPFYWLAAEKAFGLRTAGMYYCALRDRLEYAGWGEKPDCLEKAAIEPFSNEWLGAAIERSVRSAREIAGGRIAPDPSDLSRCRWCEFRDVCRFEGAAIAVAEAAE